MTQFTFNEWDRGRFNLVMSKRAADEVKAKLAEAREGIPDELRQANPHWVGMLENTVMLYTLRAFEAGAWFGRHYMQTEGHVEQA